MGLAPLDEPYTTSDKSVSTFQLRDSEVVVEDSPVGYVARIERTDRIEYAGPLDYQTLLALSEVSQ
jgi:hypothetical protein